MTDQDLDRAVREVFGEFGRLSTDAAAISETQDLYGLGLASHATVNIVMALEDELDIEFPDEMLTKATFSTLKSLKDAIRPLVAA